MTVATPKFGMGASALRVEDQAFITGKGRYTDDVKIDDTLHGFVVRSTIAKGRFSIVSTEAAREAEGVRLVLTGEDLGHLGNLKSGSMPKKAGGGKFPTHDIPILCRDTVCYVGDAVAFVVAETRALAQDAAELIEIDFEPEDAISDPALALADDAPLAWPEHGSNSAFTHHVGDRKKTEEAFARATHVTNVAFRNNRLVANYMEARSCVAEWNAGEDRFVLTTGSQGVHSMQKILAQQVFGLDLGKVRVVTPDVGGGFGTKMFVYREYALVMEAAKRLGQPVKWTSDRTEHFLTDSQARDNVVEASMAMDEDGRFLALKVDLVANMGAYIHQFGAGIPTIGVTMTTGVYDIGAIDVSVTGVYTNTAPVDAYRGAGRPEAALLLEKLVDACARDLGLGHDEIRRRNFIRPDQFPYTTPTGRKYDVGEFEGHMDQAMERAGWATFDQRLAGSKAAGRLRGIGMATYIEACAFAGSEPAKVQLESDGVVTLDIGTQTNGQGHATAYAQLLSEKLDIPIDRIRVRQGDTDLLDKGGGTGGSRSIPLGGTSTARAGADLALKIRKIAADELEASTEDIELADGSARIVGTDRMISFADIAGAAKSPEDIRGFGEFKQDEATYPNGTHICEVEIDPDTGNTEVLRYTVVDDYGAVVNPILLEGQVHGGVVQGIGQALSEEAVYGEDGQLISASFMDYAMPRADGYPFFDFSMRNVPSTTNELGLKGAGEAGTIGSTPAALNAVTDALHRAYGIGHVEMPATPLRLWSLINDARGM